jgi:membrane protease YdiL (CAAX protease family)
LAAHLPFSPLFALVALLAGLGYGLVFYCSGRLWPAVALRTAVNLTHVLLLSYPLRSA